MNGFRISNWQKFQHYTKRNPPWIKLHYEIMSSEDWVTLSDASRVLAIACMLVASRNEGVVPNKPDYLRRVAYLNKTPNFKPLLDSGFLTPLADASTMLADACSESESDSDSESDSETDSETDSRAEALRVLDYLNQVTGRKFGKTKDIEACLKRDGATFQDCKLVIDYKWAEWSESSIAKNVNPTTPFRPKHFQTYLDEAKAGPVGGFKQASKTKVGEGYKAVQDKIRRMIDEDFGPADQ